MLKEGVEHVAVSPANSNVAAGGATMFAVLAAVYIVTGDKSCFPYTHPPSGDII